MNKDSFENIPYYCGSLTDEELLDWIEAVDNHFDYKEADEEKRVNFSKARLKGSTLVWWNMMQEEILRAGKRKINS